MYETVDMCEVDREGYKNETHQSILFHRTQGRKGRCISFYITPPGCRPDAASPRGCVQIRVTSHYYTSMVLSDIKDKYDLANRLKQYTKYKVKIYLAIKVYSCFECHLQTSNQGYTWYY